jgi:hypothetical protein
MQPNIKWLNKWDIHLNRCPTNSKEIKAFVIDRFHKRTWEKGLERKKEYYIEEFNPTYNHHQKAYIEANISWRAKMLIAQLRTNSINFVVKLGVGKDQKKLGKKGCVCLHLRKSGNRKTFHFRV